MARFVLDRPLKLQLFHQDAGVDVSESISQVDLIGTLSPEWATCSIRIPKQRTEYRVAADSPAAPVTFDHGGGNSTTVGPMIAGVEIYIGSGLGAIELALRVMGWMRDNEFARPRIQRRSTPGGQWT